MKKFFIAVSVLAALMFSVVPSQALVAMPDDVPARDFRQGFFLVDMAGYLTNTGLDTLVAITDVACTGTFGKTAGVIHWVLRDKCSREIINDDVGYTPCDVLPLSVRDLLKSIAAPSDLARLEYDLDGDGFNDTYVGYIDFEGIPILGQVNNLIGAFYLVNLEIGRASGANMAGQETATPVTLVGGLGTYDSWQSGFQFGRAGAGNETEFFSGNALGMSRERERGIPAAGLGEVSYLRLLPRVFLKDVNAENYVFLWTDINHGWDILNPSEPCDNWNCDKIIEVYDDAEHHWSRYIEIPWELNIINVRDILPSGTTSFGGWLDINFARDSRCELQFTTPLFSMDDQWLGWSYQIADSATAALNWAALFPVHREAGTMRWFGAAGADR